MNNKLEHFKSFTEDDLDTLIINVSRKLEFLGYKVADDMFEVPEAVISKIPAIAADNGVSIDLDDYEHFFIFPGDLYIDAYKRNMERVTFNVGFSEEDSLEYLLWILKAPIKNKLEFDTLKCNKDNSTLKFWLDTICSKALFTFDCIENNKLVKKDDKLYVPYSVFDRTLDVSQILSNNPYINNESKLPVYGLILQFEDGRLCYEKCSFAGIKGDTVVPYKYICTNTATFFCLWMFLDDQLSSIGIYSENKTTKPKNKTYIAKDGSGLVKIGRSTNVTERIKSLKCGNANIYLYAVCNEDVESKLHKKYAMYSRSDTNGKEWFHLTDKQIEDIVNKYNFNLCKENE